MWNKVVDFSSECAEGDLQKTFLKYPGSYINGYTANYTRKEDEGSCVELCGSVTECRTVEYGYNACILRIRTALDVPVSAWITGVSTYSHYQKMCAWGSGQISGPSRHSMNTTTTRCSGSFGHLRWCSDCLTTSLLNCTRSAPIRVLF